MSFDIAVFEPAGAPRDVYRLPPTESFEDALHPGLVLRTETLGTHEEPSDDGSRGER